MNWVQPPELGGSPPRPVRLTGTGIFLLVAAVLVLAAGIALGYTIRNRSIEQSQTRQILQEQGTETDATVTRLWRSGGKSKTPRVAYQFPADGKVIRGDASISRKLWESLSEGSRVRVRYLPANPMLNRPAESPLRPAPIWLSWAVPVVAGVISLLMGYSLRRQRRLLEDGRVAVGAVTKVSVFKGSKIIQYEFVLPGGSRQSGKGGAKPGADEVGSEVTVIYDPDNPKHNGAYPFELVRAAE
jgi:hypothetical protein